MSVVALDMNELRRRRAEIGDPRKRLEEVNAARTEFIKQAEERAKQDGKTRREWDRKLSVAQAEAAKLADEVAELDRTLSDEPEPEVVRGTGAQNTWPGPTQTGGSKGQRRRS